MSPTGANPDRARWNEKYKSGHPRVEPSVRLMMHQGRLAKGRAGKRVRKVEDEKHSGAGSQSIEPRIGGAGGPGRRRQTLFMGAVALASAAVTAVALTLFTLGSA